MAHPVDAYLKANGLTHQQLAKKARVSRSTITKVLNGKRRRFSPEAAKRIARVTKLPIETLLGLSSAA